MPLYRKNSTGELVILSDAEAGYTLLDAPDNPEDWRTLDTFGEASVWHPSLAGEPEYPGDDTRAGSGINIMPNDYASFEWIGASPPLHPVNATAQRVETGWHRKYAIRYVNTGANGVVWLTQGDTYNIDLPPNARWIVSVYVAPSSAVARVVTLTLRTDTGAEFTVTGQTENVAGTYVRISGVFNLTNNLDKTAKLGISVNVEGVSIDFDAVMLEQQVGPLETPSEFHSPWTDVIPPDTLPDYGIPEWKLTQELNGRIDLIDGDGDGTVNARIAEVRDALTDALNDLEDGSTDITVVTNTGTTTLRAIKSSTETSLAGIISINEVSSNSASANARATFGVQAAVSDPNTGLTSKASLTQLTQAKADILGSSVTQFTNIQAEFNNKQAQIDARATKTELNQAKSDIYGAAVSAFTNIQAQFTSQQSQIAAKAGVTQMNEAIATAKGEAIASSTQQVYTTLGGNQAIVQAKAQSWDGVAGAYTVKIDVNGYVAGFGLWNQGGSAQFLVNADKFAIGKPGATTSYPFYVETGTGRVYMYDAFVKTLSAEKISSGTIGAQTINLNGASSILKSSNYVAGSAGWLIRGDGFAEFRNVTIRGSLNATDVSGGTLNFNNFTASNINAGSITAGTLNGTNIAVTNLNATNITTGTLNGARVGTGVSGDVLTTGTLNASLVNVTNLNASNITTGTLNAARINSGTITSQDITLNGGSIRSQNYLTSGGSQGWAISGAGDAVFNTVMVRTKNIELGAVSYSVSGSAQPGFVNPANSTWINSFAVTIPANSNRGKVFTQVFWVADGGSTLSPVYLNLRLRRDGSTLLTSAYNSVLNTLTLSWCDESAPTSAFTYYVDVLYYRDFSGGFYRTLSAAIFELKR